MLESNTDCSHQRPGLTTELIAFLRKFFKKLSFLCISNQVLDFSGLKHDIADLYARGFASL